MPLTAILLLFVSAILHTAWNILLKQAGEKYIATWWAVLVGSAVFLPALFFTGLPLRETWGLLITTVQPSNAPRLFLTPSWSFLCTRP